MWYNLLLSAHTIVTKRVSSYACSSVFRRIPFQKRTKISDGFSTSAILFESALPLGGRRFFSEVPSSTLKERTLPSSGPGLHYFINQATAAPNETQDTRPVHIPYLPENISNVVDQGRIYIETYGCQMNVNDMEIVLAIMKNAGYTEIVEKAEEADVILINTCAIREHAESKVWQRLNYFKHLKSRWKQNLLSSTVRSNAAPKVAVLGCMAERLKEKLVDANKMIDVVCGPDAYRDLPRLLASVDQGQTAVNTLLSLEETYADVTPVRVSKNSVSAFVSIMRGCNNMCAFCIVPFTRGRERSRPVNSIITEVGHLWEEGVKEVVLLGQNVNSYNDLSSNDESLTTGRTKPWHHSSGFSSICRSKEDGLRFSDLLDNVSARYPEMRFRFTSPHPKDFPDELLHLMHERPNICKHIHLPAQSGSTQVLERMRRGYTREAYISLVERIRTILPDSSLSSDFIAGFCGETDEDHADTLSLIEIVGYDMAYMFAYSLREKTYAHRKYTDDVPEEVKQRRLSEIIETFRRTSVPRFESQVGTTQLVLVTGPSKRDPTQWIGQSDKGHKVIFPNQHVTDRDREYEFPRPGDYVEVKITHSSSASLHGTAIARTNLASYVSKMPLPSSDEGLLLNAICA